MPARGDDADDAEAGSSRRTGTKAAAIPPTVGAFRASRSQVNRCCGLIPFRRATTDTTAPDAMASARIRLRSDCDQRRRPLAVVMTSSRRTVRGGSTICSTIDTKRSHPGAVSIILYAGQRKVGSKHRIRLSRSRCHCVPPEVFPEGTRPGFDHGQRRADHRSGQGWHRHVSLVMLAFAIRRGCARWPMRRPQKRRDQLTAEEAALDHAGATMMTVSSLPSGPIAIYNYRSSIRLIFLLQATRRVPQLTKRN
ncbi:hypothetical protein SAMN04488144_1713 [Methylobacterium sp. 190mf]|nr:hypothetical protein SAMN04488144_1713 [Methylobacterium sp. 190mf]